MQTFQQIKPEDFNQSPFRIIGKDWMLVTAEKDGRANSMTASWGGLGVMWGKNVAFIVVRKSRFTKEFVDGADTFSLTFFDRKQYGKMLGYMGTVSGRDEDKIAKSALTVAHRNGTPYFEEAEKVIICRKLFCLPLTPEHFIDSSIDNEWYKDKDYHDLYIAEVTDILIR
ncbi:MAG: flavin reductase [Deferribacterales bacterium]